MYILILRRFFMKTRQKLWLIAFVAILTLAITACPDSPSRGSRTGGNNNPPSGNNPCLNLTSVPKCNRTGCTCAPKVYGNINGIPVYRESAVTDIQATTAFNEALAIYTMAHLGAPVAVANINSANVTAIHLIGGISDWDADKKILKIQHTLRDDDMIDFLLDTNDFYILQSTRADPQTPINNLFNEGFSATVKGIQLTASEWFGVANKIKDALNGAFEGGNIGIQSGFRTVFDRIGGVTIYIERNPSYANWKTIGDGVTLYLNLAALDNLPSTILAAVTSMANNETETD
jgi:hypothetical protein